MALLRLLILCWILACGSFIARSQSISELNSLLDSTLYSQIHIKEYRHHLSLPDSTQKKVVRVLEGYIPPHIQQRVSILDSSALKGIEYYALRLCASDTLCFRKTKDSLTADYIQHNMELLKEEPFQETFILAVGSWGIKEAIPILRSNLDNPRFPKVATLLALSKLGDNGSKDSVMKLLEVKDTVFTEIMPRGYISEQKHQLIKAGNYLQDKAILSRIVDLLDVEGKAILFDRSDAVPSELLTILELSLCFIERKYIDNNSLYKWEGLTDQFFNEINHNLNNLQALKTILSEENKLRVKSQLKSWIDKYVVFE